MKKLTLALIIVVMITVFAACTGETKVDDGVYRAEFEDYDEYGYKDYLEVTFRNGEIVKVVADAISYDGTLKTQSQELKDKMLSAGSVTYPEKYYQDLVNLYMADPDPDEIDVIAGATKSSDNFKILARELEKSIRAGYTETVIVKR